MVKALASHQCGPGSIPGLDVICGLSLLLVLYPAPRGFSPGTPVFPSPQKPTFPNSNSIRRQDLPENHFAVSGASWVNIMIFFIAGKYFVLTTHPLWENITPISKQSKLGVKIGVMATQFSRPLDSPIGYVLVQFFACVHFFVAF